MSNCPHIFTADEGTSHCTLASVTAEQWQKMRNALKVANTAMNDWTVRHAGDHCSDEDVEETSKRIFAHGATLGYIGHVQEIIAEALNPTSPKDGITS
jgi:hypothetical protein